MKKSPLDLETPAPEEKKKQVAVYIDGYNLYESCRKVWRTRRSPPPPGSVANKYDCYDEFLEAMWYDPRKIAARCGGLGDNCDITANFYTAQPLSPRSYTPSDGRHHRGHFTRYTDALTENGVTVKKGEFKTPKRVISGEAAEILNDKLANILKQNSITKRGKKILEEFDAFIAKEKLPFSVEKMTDVRLATDIVKHVYQNTGCDVVVLISSDSDFDPVIKLFIENNPDVDFLVLLPPAQETEGEKTRKESIEEKMLETAKEAEISFDGEKFRVVDISIADIEECNLSAERKLDNADKQRRRRYCECEPGACKWKN